MKKRILFGVVVALGAVVALPMFSAFEAHVINVTAQIENALAVTTKAIDFGTVFPQEHLEQPFDITLSQSFLAEDRVDDVEYIIRQKPKCAITRNDGTVIDPQNTATGHIKFDEADKPYIDCGQPPRELQEGEKWGVLPLLCPYLSKHERSEDGSETNNDGWLPAFHEPWTYNGHQVVWNDVHGRLAKSAQDINDRWIIDLAVPCFGGYCAQDWADFVHEHNQTADPQQYTRPIEDEHKVFGCDLWVEVTEVSETRGKLIVIKDVINNDEEDPGTKLPGDFTIDVTATNPSNDMFAGESAPGTMVFVDPGVYSVDEVDDLGYTKTLSADCSGVIAAGETKTCTITNDDPTTT